jgi:sec-independent protein translocase protein TatA
MGMQEWWPILIIVLLLFGARKLPDLARSLGSSVNEFKKGMAEGAKDDTKGTTEVRSSAPPPPSSNGPSSSRNER